MRFGQPTKGLAGGGAPRLQVRGVAFAALVLFLPLFWGCRTQRAPLAPSPAVLAETPPPPVAPLSVDLPAGDLSKALSHYATAVSLSLEAGRLEQLFNYQRMRTGTRQPSLLRDARSRREGSLAQLDQAIEQAGATPALLRRKGDILFDLGRIDEAVLLYTSAENGGPAAPRWYFSTAGRLEMVGRVDSAAGLLEGALRHQGDGGTARRGAGLDGGFARLALLELGRLYEVTNRLDESAATYRRALEDIEKHKARGGSPLERAFARRIAEDPTGVRRVLVSVLVRQKKFDEAVDEAKKALATAPHDARALESLLDAYAAWGKEEEGVKAARAFLAGNSGSQPAVLALMRLLEKQGEVDEAVEAGKMFLVGRPSDALVRSEIIALYRRSGRAAEAEAFALGAAPGSVGYRESLALLDVYGQSKDERKAFDLVLKVLDENRFDVNAALQMVSKLASSFPREAVERFRSEFNASRKRDYRVDYAWARVLAGRGEAKNAFEIFKGLAAKKAPYGDVYEAVCAEFLSERKVVEAAVALLDGVEHGYVPRPEILLGGFVEASLDPLEDAARIEELLPTYDTSHTTMYRILAGLYSAGGNDALAETFYRRALEDPTPSLTDYGGLALSLYRQDKTAEAIELIESLIGKGQGAPPLVRMLVSMLSGDGRTEQAKRLALKLIAESPTDVDNRLALVGILIDEANYPGAEDELLTARGLAEGDEQSLTRVRYYLGIVYEEQGKGELAVSMWQANIAAGGDQADSYNAIAYHYAQAGENLDTALEYVNKALSGDPENAAFLDTLGWIYYKMGDYDAAVDNLRRAAAKMSDAVIFDHLGDALLAAGDAQGALSAWKKALLNNPKPKDRSAIEEKIASHSSLTSDGEAGQKQGDVNGGS